MTLIEGTKIVYGPQEYLVGPQINSGGFGKVFHLQRVKPSPLGLAVKVPADHVLKDEVWLKKFAREARILANINHPNVVKIIAFWEFADGSKALAQELIEGAQRLNEYVKKQPDKASSALVQSLYALRAFHGAGKDNAAIHRDLSPNNILVDQHGTVKVIDFGLAKEDPRVTEVLTRADEGFGTYGCMAPEQADRAAEVDHRADLFALGKSFAAAVQNRFPQHVVVGKLPEPWRSICGKLTEHEVVDRYQSATECLSAALAAFASAGIELRDFDIHVTEMQSWNEVIDGWPQICDLHFKSQFDLAQADVEIAARLNPNVFLSGFDADALLSDLESGSGVKAFVDGNASFDDCDPLGLLYSRLYPALSPANKLVCFKRLVDVALRWHRYAVMGNVRDVFRIETVPEMTAQLVQVLDADDPKKEIHGHDLIPGR